MIGFGCIGQGVLPLLLRHIDMPPSRIQVIAADDAGAELAQAHGVALQVLALTHENLREASRALRRRRRLRCSTCRSTSAASR